MKALILGANFTNKGAQSMLFVAMNELFKRYPNCEIYFAVSAESNELDRLCNFKTVAYTYRTQQYLLDGAKGQLVGLYVHAKNTLYRLCGKKNKVCNIGRFTKLIPEIDLIIDVSGFHLGDKFDYLANKFYLNSIRVAKKYNIPMYLMPQSFGPFEFKTNRDELLSDIKELLPYPKKIFAREKAGFELLKSFGLDNVTLSTDMVLQSKVISPDKVYKSKHSVDTENITTENNVAVIPNRQCLKFGNADRVFDVYKSVINELLNEGRNVYIFCHSAEDLHMAENIKEIFPDNDKVQLFKNDFSCFEYNEMMKFFDFIIVSRYHAMVHAYRNDIPCIVFGWAVKYNELAAAVGQGGYVFDITQSNSDFAIKSVSAVKDMNLNWQREKKTIADNMKVIQKDNCFNYVER